MRLISWNVNGIRSILSKGFFSFLRESQATVICLQEIRAYPSQVADVCWPAGWHLFWNPASRYGYAGTLLMTRQLPLLVTTGLGIAQHDNEGRVISAEFPGFYLVNVYTPNSGRKLTRLDYRIQEWTPAFLGYLLRLMKKKPIIFCGDMNVAHQKIDLARPHEHARHAGFTTEERMAFSKILAAGFLDTFRIFHTEGGNYTWWSYQKSSRARNVGWRIDYFCVSAHLRGSLCDAFIWPFIPGSDHCPVGVEIFV
ncbi:exodeoxyribonuclease III [Candidatus Xiphinematobacter sp. Idaho Grape]|uniref:exodeoxyribonuclease III n=1 Tax=Candidatus Xiphinematobacter sp. Idaho Grape TaxID=1704307 RepID=UPI00078602BE|nr:exodeoxyribonuclease III [Candidatus Xiphinematobacter sp. Idaho Grape]